MVLLLSLAMLAGLSLLALLAANSMLQQQQMAANHADSELARLSAMTAVAAGEKLLMNLPNEYRTEPCETDCFLEPARSWILSPGSLPPYPEHQPDAWWLQNGQAVNLPPVNGAATGDPMTSWPLQGRNPPLFLVQELKFQPAALAQDGERPVVAGVAYYQVLGHGSGISRGNTHVVESIIARPWLAEDPAEPAGNNPCNTFRPVFDCGRMAYRERR